MFGKIKGKKKTKKVGNKPIGRQNDKEKFSRHHTYCNNQGHIFDYCFKRKKGEKEKMRNLIREE